MIRTYQNTDAKSVQTIALTCFDQNIRGEKKLYLARYFIKSYFKAKNIEARLKNPYELYVLEDNQKIVGFIEIEKGMTITNIFVLPEAQSHGYGRQLLDYAIERCQELHPDLKAVGLDASTSAIGFYKHYGFTDLPRMKKIMGVEMYTMEKKLKNN